MLYRISMERSWAKNIGLDDPKIANVILICLDLILLRCTEMH